MSGPEDAIEALVGLWRADLVGVQVEDGPPVVDLSGDVILVGFTPENLPLTAVAEVADLRGGNNEAFIVASVARSWSGSAEIAPVRRRCYEMVEAAKSSVRADPTLGGRVARARYVGHTYAPSRNEQGQLIVDVVFQFAVNVFV